MNIHGLQKMTLLDYPGIVAATVFLGGCDYRCPYCHNFELVDGTASPIMSDQELFLFLEKRKNLLDGVVITGGEPCLRPDLPQLVKAIKDMGYKVKLDTNGNHPDVLRKLLEAGLVDYVAMDIKNSLPKYGMTIGVPGFDTKDVQESAAILLDGSTDYEFRTTVVHEFHELNDFELIGQWIEGAKAYYLQQYTVRDTVPDKSLTSPTEEDMRLYLDVVKKYVPNAVVRGV
ncbi:MAG: anaerobic ribonucleoside-triphosphate reductase activating protein [Butyrivibrio sp.]|jgi:pyruvate formate lyase activating enzyme|nr:anaerobic ribonucleoside-triphosphate reductase activating protein [Butyrivibrio sp.]